MHTVVNESTIISKILHELEIPKAPKISLVGMASAGKSSLVNALFGNPIANVKKSANTTDCIVETTFKSNLVIYDTPGVGGDERLENVTRAFLGLQQLSDFHMLQKIPFREYNKEDIVYMPIDKIKDKAPIDFVLFIVDLDRTLLRKEQKDIEKLIDEIDTPYKNHFMVVGTHLDLIEDLEEKHEIINGYQSLSHQHFVTVSSLTGKGLDNLVISLFNLMPNETYLSTLQQSLIDARKIAKDRLAVIDISKRIATLLTEEDDAYSRKLRILALYASICNHYSIDALAWEKYKKEAVDLGDKVSKYKRIKTQKEMVEILTEVFLMSYKLILSLSNFDRKELNFAEIANEINENSEILYEHVRKHNKEELSIAVFNKLSKVLL